MLRSVLIPFINQHQNVMTFQHDGVTLHTAGLTNRFLTQNNIQVLPWPAVSPDMNPIEHVWDMLGRSIRQMNPRPRTVQDLQAALIDKRNNIPQRDLRTLCLSMRRRCTALPDDSQWQSHPLLTLFTLYFSSINNKCYLQLLHFRFESIYL